MSASEREKAPWAAIEYAEPHVVMERRDNGECLLASATPLGAYERQVSVWLRRWAKARPSGVFLAERARGDGWRHLSYAEAREAADSLSQALLDRGLGPDRPVMLLSGNSIDHALLSLGAMQVGVPVVPVSPAYSLMSRDYAKVEYIFELCTPGLVYAADSASFAPALGALDLESVEVVASGHQHGEPGDKATSFASLVATPPSPAVDAAFDRVGPDSVCKVLFTSGSTGTPKGVINTQRMLCSSQQALAQVWPFVEADPPVLLDWLPWNHTFGGNNNFNLVLRNGGTLYIDEGKPAPGLFDISIANLREVSPNIYYNVPAGFQMLLTALESDEALRDNFFSRLKVVMYAGAALPPDAWHRLESLSEKSLGKRVPLTSAWGSTETAPMATIAHFIRESAGNIGVPAPGVTIKMVPAGDKMELRIKGPNVTPGYYRRDNLTKAAFDDEGFYCIGDAGRLIDPDDANRGIAFDGRVAEDFKLSTGTWVAAGALRVAALAAVGPTLRDAVVTGHDRNFVGLLAWPDIEACRAMAGAGAGASPESIIAHPKIRAHVATQLAVHNREAGGKSRRIHRVLLMMEPPSIDANEITDKGYINQRATLTRRAELVGALYAEPPGPDVIVIQD